jgi:hypothetical protein
MQNNSTHSIFLTRGFNKEYTKNNIEAPRFFSILKCSNSNSHDSIPLHHPQLIVLLILLNTNKNTNYASERERETLL